MQILGASAQATSGLHAAATAALDQLRAVTSQTVHLSVLDGLEVVYVERRESPGAVRMFGRIGHRGPAHSTASGKVLLAFLPPEELDRRLVGVRLARRTPYTITSKDQLRAELLRVRARGWAENVNEAQLGFASVGAPIRNPAGEVVAALSVAGPVRRGDGDNLRRFARPVTECAVQISRRLGWGDVAGHVGGIVVTGLSDPAVAGLAAALYAARSSGVPIEPLTDSHPAMSVRDAYRIQQDLVARLVADGDRIVGYKLGLTSLPMQRMFGVDSPDFAPVLASHVHPDGAQIAAASFIRPRVEAEIALVLAEDLAGPDCTALDVASAVSGAASAIEIVDSRIADWRIKLADTIADLASSGAIVLGAAITPIGGVDLRLAGMVFTRDGEIVATGAGAAALGSPLHAVAWLVRTLEGVGASLRAGQFIMTGALHAAVDIAPGQRYRAEVDRLGPIGLRVI